MTPRTLHGDISTERLPCQVSLAGAAQACDGDRPWRSTRALRLGAIASVVEVEGV